MDYSIPILICEESFEICAFLRDMLTRHGFFHIEETYSSGDFLHIVSKYNGQFILIEKKILNFEIKNYLDGLNNFLVISPNSDVDTPYLAARYGVDHLISFPYTSKDLIKRITRMIN